MAQTVLSLGGRQVVRRSRQEAQVAQERRDNERANGPELNPFERAREVIPVGSYMGAESTIMDPVNLVNWSRRFGRYETKILRDPTTREFCVLIF